MTKLTKEELKNALVDVRKAYRLLYFYHRRILDTVEYISNFIEGNQIKGFPLFSNAAPASGKKIDTQCWAWDWLNMYLYEFLFIDRNINEGGYLKFGISIQSDTGYFDAEEISKTEVSAFRDPAEASTRFLFYIGKNFWKEDCQSFQDFFKQNETKYKEIADGKIFLAKAYDLTELMDEDSILTCLQDFKSFCDTNGVSEFRLVS